MSEETDVTFKDQVMEWLEEFPDRESMDFDEVRHWYAEKHPKAVTAEDVALELQQAIAALRDADDLPAGATHETPFSLACDEIVSLRNAQPTDAKLRACAEEIASVVVAWKDRADIHAILARHFRGAE